MLSNGSIVSGRYKILRQIGRGGTSFVYLAEVLNTFKQCAIKEVFKNDANGRSVANSNMLIAESSILTKLRHSGLPSIIEIIDTPTACLIVMDYIAGVSLDKVLQQRGTCSERDVIKWGIQLCQVLQYLHRQNPPIIYRDMKPANIILKHDGNIVLIDFGTARKFKSFNNHDTANLGTHGYAAPEQYKSDRQSDARTDIYSLGVTLYHLVTGHDPCVPPYGINSLQSHNPNLSKEFDAIIQKCTNFSPEKRYQSAMALEAALKGLISPVNAVKYVPEIKVQKPADIPEKREVQKIDVEFNKPAKKSSNLWLLSLAFIPLFIGGILAVVLNGDGGTSANNTNAFQTIGTYVYNLFEDSEDATLYFEELVLIDEVGKHELYTFTPEKTGSYYIYSVSENELPVIWITDENDKVVADDNIRGEYTDFAVQCWLKKGKEYYIETALYDIDGYSPTTGEYWLCVQYVE